MNRQTPTSTKRSLSDRVRALLNLRPGEVAPAFLLSALYFAIVGAIVFLEATTYGLFIEEFGADGLTYAYLLIAILAGGMAFVYMRFSERISLERLVRFNLIFSLGMFIAYWLGLQSPIEKSTIFLLPLWLQIIANLGSLTVWPLAGRMFDLRQAKRAFAVVVVGYWLSNFVMGVVVAPVVERIGLPNLLLISMGWVICAGAILMILFRTQKMPPEPAQDVPTRTRITVSPFKNPYARLIFASTLFWWITYYFIDIIFYQRAAIEFSDSETLAGFLGQLIAATGIAALVITLFISSRIVNRFGLKAGLLLEPVLVGATFIVVVIVGFTSATSPWIFWLVALAKLLNLALGGSISTSTFTLLYQPFPENQRTRVQTLAEGLFQPAAIGFSGLSLLALTTVLNFDAIRLSAVFLVIAAGWLIVTVILIRQYPLALAQALAQHQLGSLVPDFSDADSQRILKESLKGSKPNTVIYALTTLQATDPNFQINLPAWLPDLLAHEASEVRLTALDLAASPGIEVTGAVLPFLEKAASPAEKAAALRALGKNPAQQPILVAAINDSEPEVRRAALAGLLSRDSRQPDAQMALQKLANSAARDERLLAAGVIQDLASPEAADLLQQLLADPDPVVRRASMLAAPGIGHPAVWRAVVETTSRPETARAAIRILSEGGPIALQAIADKLSESELPTGQFLALARAAGKTGKAEAVESLRAHIHHPDPVIRIAILEALGTAGYRAEAQAFVYERIREELKGAVEISAGLAFFPAETHLLLRDALLDELRDVRQRVVALLGFTVAGEKLAPARPALLQETIRGQDYALELLDTALPVALKPTVFALFEPLGEGERNNRWAAAGLSSTEADEEAWLGAVLGDPPGFRPKAWTRICLQHNALRLGLGAEDGLESAVGAFQEEAAAWSPSQSGLEIRGQKEMQSLIDRVLVLRTCAMFRHIPDPVLAAIGILLTEVELAAGAVVFPKGEMGESLYVVMEGALRIIDGDRLINTLGPGEAFGEMALLDPEPRVAAVIAEGPVRLLKLGQEAFDQLLSEVPDFSRDILRVLTHRLRETGRGVAR